MSPPCKKQRTGSQASLLGFVSSSKAEIYDYRDGAAVWRVGSLPALGSGERRWTATVKLKTPLDRTLTLSTSLHGDSAAFYQEASAYKENSVPLLKSHLQKAVRRMNAQCA